MKSQIPRLTPHYAPRSSPPVAYEQVKDESDDQTRHESAKDIDRVRPECDEHSRNRDLDHQGDLCQQPPIDGLNRLLG